MKPTELAKQQVERFMRKTAEKFPSIDIPEVMTDIHIRVNQDTGDIMSYDDDGNEITRGLVEDWMGNTDDAFYDEVAQMLRSEFRKNKNVADNFGIMKPYSFVLEDEDGDNKAELYVADDTTVIIGGDLMKGLDDDLDKFFNKLMEE